MANLSPGILILILLVSAIIALLVGYFLGSRFGGKKSVAMKEATEQHDGYRNDVREHFEQTSAIMSRMVDDYRDMYEHLSDGAEKLADLHPEKLVTPPPAPEAITRDAGGHDSDAASRGSRATAASSATHSGAVPNRDAVMNSDSSNDRPWNKEKGGKRYGLE